MEAIMDLFVDEERARIQADPMSALHVQYTPSVVLPFEHGLPHEKIVKFFMDYWHYTVHLSLLYIAIVLGLQQYMLTRKPLRLRWTLVAWNGGLAVFSIMGTIRTLEELVFTLSNHGIHKSLCFGYEPSSVAAHWYLFFAISKIVELGDTVFLALKKRPLTFLHCYHHCTVLVYTFHSGSEVLGMGRWFMGMNFIAHSFMYTYYALMSAGFKVPKGVAKFVTSIQLIQMFVGLLVSFSATIAKHLLHLPCQQSLQNLYLAYGIYASYAVLFLQFFLAKYSSKSKTE
ncbi:unnamed protein product [Bursaphelenchus xylophilus]|uniref:Elongation of very long chain fatty acids protein n=1 Tax=Bursaphelenchus xylophilus TaxID=6326 RepID=A0A1I7SDN4_BURXY|nr:unnamed protein product [Bursaphelenchus xylophilus]CAG9120917.1 unnamed protein product [Bursaphelenchus xylophilus]